MRILKKLAAFLLFSLPAAVFAAGICGTGTLLTTYNPFTNKLDYVCVNTGGGTTSLPLPPGDTNYIQNRATLQAGTTAYPGFLYVGSSGTFFGPVLIVATNSVSGLKINANGTYGTTNGTSGGFVIDCTGGGGSSGFCGQFYTNAGAQSALGGLVNVIADNAAWNEPLIYIQNAATGFSATDIRIDSRVPSIAFVETDQTAPAGKFQWSINNDTMRFESRNAGNSAFEPMFIVVRSTSAGRMFIGNTYTVPVSTLDVQGCVTIGESLAGVTPAPNGGLLVQGLTVLQGGAQSISTFSVTVNGTSVAVFSSTGSHIRGVQDNSLANSFDVGYASKCVSPETMFSFNNTYQDFCNVTISSGDWMIVGLFYFENGGGTNTKAAGGISTFSGNDGTGLTGGDNYLEGPPPTSAYQSSFMLPYHVRLNTSTTYYLKGYFTFSGANPFFRGSIEATRIR